MADELELDIPDGVVLISWIGGISREMVLTQVFEIKQCNFRKLVNLFETLDSNYFQWFLS